MTCVGIIPTIHAMDVATGPMGERAHKELIEHSKRFEKKLYQVTDKVYCLVGYGLANATLVLGDGGAVVIDSGECVEEAEEHLAAFRTVTDLPIKAVIYTHFHYVNGTRAYFDAFGDVEVWGHHRVAENAAGRFAEAGPNWFRRALVQFGYYLPEKGPDALPNCGIGPAFAPQSRIRKRTPGYVPPTHLIEGETEATISGIRFSFVPADSDSNDTIIIHVPDENVVINNHAWPAFYNIYTLRGGRYRDPQGLLDGLDVMIGMAPAHLVGVHGPPIEGRETIAQALTEYRDAIQFVWDQSVRGINKGLDADELVEFVEVPEHLRTGLLTHQNYGLIEHHVRQIYQGLVGWFGNDCADLFPPRKKDVAKRTVEGFGGIGRTLEMAEAALASGDVRWAVHLATWVLGVEPQQKRAKKLKADGLRQLAQDTTAASVRAFCLTQARALEGSGPPVMPLRIPRSGVREAPPERFVKAMRVDLNPEKSRNAASACEFSFSDTGTKCILEVRRGVALYRDEGEAPVGIELSHKAWANLYCAKQSLSELAKTGELTAKGALEDVQSFFDLFDRR